MPEGHVLHRLAGELNARFTGPVVVSSPQGRFRAEAALVDGREMTGAEAWGKHLFVGFGDLAVHIHLGLIGKMSITRPADPVGEVRLRLATDEWVAVLRGPQTCRLVDDDGRQALIAKLGPDPLRSDADPARAWRRIQASDKPIAALLMDQQVIAGAGNIYRAEVLFRSHVDPRTPGRRLPPATWTAIWTDLVRLMRDGVRTGRIDTVRPEHTPTAMGRPPRVDDHGGEVYVYRRAGQPCLVCGTEVQCASVVGRNLYWCPRCQAA